MQLRTALIKVILATQLLVVACDVTDVPKPDPSVGGATVKDVTEEKVSIANQPGEAGESISAENGAAVGANEAVEISSSDAANAADDASGNVEEVAENGAAAAQDDVNWLTITARVEHDLAAIGNPNAPLVITEFSDFM